MTHEVYRVMLIEKLIPDMVDKWPPADRATIALLKNMDGTTTI